MPVAAGKRPLTASEVKKWFLCHFHAQRPVKLRDIPPFLFIVASDLSYSRIQAQLDPQLFKHRKGMDEAGISPLDSLAAVLFLSFCSW